MIDVDRLTLHVPQMSEDEAQRLAHEVAAALRGWATPAGTITADRVQATVPTPAAGTTTTSLAADIAAAIVRTATQEAGR